MTGMMHDHPLRYSEQKAEEINMFGICSYLELPCDRQTERRTDGRTGPTLSHPLDDSRTKCFARSVVAACWSQMTAMRD